MTQEERRIFLIKSLLGESSDYADVAVPQEEEDQQRLLRSLMNVRPALPATDAFLTVQDEYLSERNRERGITDSESLVPVQDGLYLWRGDITTLRIDAIVNAANSGMTGCWQPCHACIDNCIHTFAGIQLRSCCADIMEKQGHPEPTGTAKITPAFNLPCKYVLHTVGPIVSGRLTQTHCEQLASCYVSCLDLAEQNGVTDIAFCCISTGVFMFPAEKAARIAVDTVRSWRKSHGSTMRVVFNVFSQKDEALYASLLKS